MFGYVICNKSGLSEKELLRYRSLYCGVCKSLEQRFGQMERVSLNYDMTFLALFLSALYEPEEQRTRFRCPCHPIHRREYARNEFVDYAADMTIAFSYHKCLDDWNDERRKRSRIYGKILKRDYERIRKQYPRQCRMIEKSLKELNGIEKSSTSLADEAVNCSGRMLSELFVFQEDFWSDTLRRFGYELGRFIYLMDAVMDYQKDIKNHNFNPLIRMKRNPKDMEDILTMVIGNATDQFEKLPIVQDDHLIRNILYGGVWQKYYAEIKGKEKSDDFRSL